MKQRVKQRAWTDLQDKNLTGWLRHCSQLQAKMDRGVKKYHPFGRLSTPTERFALALYGEICNLAIEAKARLKIGGPHARP